MKPTLDPSSDTCREFLGVEQGYCPRPAHVADTDGFRHCWPHAEERAAFLARAGGA